MQPRLLAVAFLVAACRVSNTAAPTPTSAPSAMAASASTSRRIAKPADVASIDAILAALYDSVSGPPGPRDWDRVRSLFAPGGWVAPVEARPDGRATARIMSIDAFVETASRKVSAEGFYEKEIFRKSDAFGNIVHVFSTYEARHRQDDAVPFRRGINSIQLLKDGDRYWVVSIYWDTERTGTLIPSEYLPSR